MTPIQKLSRLGLAVVIPHKGLTQDQETFAQRIIQALSEWWTSLGAAAWAITGGFILVGTIALVLLLRWIQRGGLARHRHLPLTESKTELPR